MRIWHQSLISHLPRQQLLGQHRECCALRGKGWGRNHSVVNYVFTYSPAKLVAYHMLIIAEMLKRGYHPDEIWSNPAYRGKILGVDENFATSEEVQYQIDNFVFHDINIYPEHNDEYLKECLDNLSGKGIVINL